MDCLGRGYLDIIIPWTGPRKERNATSTLHLRDLKDLRDTDLAEVGHLFDMTALLARAIVRLM